MIHFSLCLQRVTAFFASTSSKLLCWSSHLKSELLYGCTLRKEGIFQDKAGHCSHIYSLITLRLLHSSSIALKHFGAASMIITLWQYNLWHHSKHCYNYKTSPDKTNSNSKYLWKIRIFTKTSKNVLKKAPTKNNPLKPHMNQKWLAKRSAGCKAI